MFAQSLAMFVFPPTSLIGCRSRIGQLQGTQAFVGRRAYDGMSEAARQNGLRANFLGGAMLYGADGIDSGAQGSLPVALPDAGPALSLTRVGD